MSGTKDGRIRRGLKYEMKPLVSVNGRPLYTIEGYMFRVYKGFDGCHPCFINSRSVVTPITDYDEKN